MSISSNEYYPAHETAMRCVEEAIDSTPDIESEYALLAVRDLFQGAPALLEAVSLVSDEIEKLLALEDTYIDDSTRDNLNGLSDHLKEAIINARPPRHTA